MEIIVAIICLFGAFWSGSLLCLWVFYKHFELFRHSTAELQKSQNQQLTELHQKINAMSSVVCQHGAQFQHVYQTIEEIRPITQ